MSAIRQHRCIQLFALEHIYREYNADADGIANEAIDAYDRLVHVSKVVVDQNWLGFHLTELHRLSLHNPEGHGMDGEGDIDMGAAPPHGTPRLDREIEHIGPMLDVDRDTLMNYSLP